MDPLTVTSAVLAVSARCIASIRSIYIICSETTIVFTSLSRMQELLLQDQELRSRPELETTFDTALTGCAIVFSVLEDELKKLLPKHEEHSPGWIRRIKLLWKED